MPEGGVTRLEYDGAGHMNKLCRGHRPESRENDGAFSNDKANFSGVRTLFTKKAHSPMTRTATASRQRTPL